MKLRHFARPGLEISNLCLGAANFGWNTDERTSHAILDTFCANGGNFIQAASGVNALGTALSEIHVGSWIKSRAIMRSELVLATRLDVRPEAALSRQGLARFVRACCEASLRRLGVDHLDILMCELRSTLTPVEALLEATAYLVDEGLVRHVGASTMPAWRLREASAAARARALPSFAVVQDEYSLVARAPFETELARACRETEALFLARSPLAGGFLTDAAGRQQGWYSIGSRMWLGAPETRSARPGWRDAVEHFARARGTSMAQAALAWVLAHPEVAAAVIGVSSPRELEPLIAAAGETMTADDVALLAHPATWGAAHRRHELAEVEA